MFDNDLWANKGTTSDSAKHFDQVLNQRLPGDTSQRRAINCACGDGPVVWTENIPSEHECPGCGTFYLFVIGRLVQGWVPMGKAKARGVKS